MERIHPEAAVYLKFRNIVFLISILSTLLACQLPGMIPLSTASRPDMETDGDTVIKVLNGTDWVALGALTKETYTQEDYSKPGTLSFTADVTNEKPVYFSYGWCTVDAATLQQNLEHITVTLSLDGDKLPGNVIHNLSFTSPDGMICEDFGVLLSNWKPGKYELKAAASFDQTINDGLADYKAGDYIFIYKISVKG